MERSHQYKVIIDDIRTKLNPGAEKDLFESAILKWKEEQDIKSYLEFLRSIQKLKKNILERMAPSDAIRASNWYEDSKGDGVITWEHRIKYIHKKDYTDQLIENTSAHHNGNSELLPTLKDKWIEWETFYYTHLVEHDPPKRDKNVRKALGFLNILIPFRGIMLDQMSVIKSQIGRAHV